MQLQANMVVNHFNAARYAVNPTAYDSGESLSWDKISKRSADSQAMLDYWDKTDAIMGGIKTMRDAGDAYLPKFPNESKEEHDFRLTQTKMTNVYSDVVEGLASKPFEEEITLDGEDKTFDEFVEDVDGAGNNLTQFGAVTFFNGINSVIDWIFIDYPNPAKGEIRTKEQQKKAGIRPFWSRVLGRNMLEAKTKIINGQEVLILARILEPGTPTMVRKFERSEDGVVNWTLYKKSENTATTAVIEDEGVITIGVIPLVPFATGRRVNKGFLFRPAMQGAVDLQIELFQQESDLKFAKKMSAFPMLAGNGVKPEMSEDGKKPKRLAVGPAVVLYAPMDGSGKAGSWAYVEPSAASLKFLAEEIKETKQDLRELGKQPLTAQSGNLTVITTAVAAGKSKSAVVAWALSLKDVLENAFKITAMWMKTNVEPSVTVYTEFDSFLDGEDGLDKLITMNEKGKLSTETLHHETKRRRYLSPEFNHTDEMGRILGEAPVNPDDNET